MMKTLGLAALLMSSLFATAPGADAQAAPPSCQWEQWTTTPGGNTYWVLVCRDAAGRMTSYTVFVFVHGPFGIPIPVPIAGGNDLNGDGDFNDPGERWGSYK